MFFVTLEPPRQVRRKMVIRPVDISHWIYLFSLGVPLSCQNTNKKSARNHFCKHIFLCICIYYRKTIATTTMTMQIITWWKLSIIKNRTSINFPLLSEVSHNFFIRVKRIMMHIQIHNCPSCYIIQINQYLIICLHPGLGGTWIRRMAYSRKVDSRSKEEKLRNFANEWFMLVSKYLENFLFCFLYWIVFFLTFFLQKIKNKETKRRMYMGGREYLL